MTEKSDDIIRVLRSRLEHWKKQEQESTAKLVKVLTEPDTTFISSFEGERFLELPALRAVVTRLTKSLATLDKGEISAEEWLENITRFYRRSVEIAAANIPSSTSVASNRMEDYERVQAVRVLATLEGRL